LCIIPARGGSKRFSRKNQALLGGKPLLSWTIEAALESEIFDGVWISSEDEEMLSIGEKWGAIPIARPPELAGDEVTIVTLCLHLLNEFLYRSRQFNFLYVLLPTSPFRKSNTIRKAWQTFITSNADALMSVVRLEHPPQWALVQKEGWLAPLYPEEYELYRHALSPAFRHDGGHAITKVSSFLTHKAFLAPRTLAFPVPAEEAIDINEPVDIAWAEYLLEHTRI